MSKLELKLSINSSPTLLLMAYILISIRCKFPSRYMLCHICNFTGTFGYRRILCNHLLVYLIVVDVCMNNNCHYNSECIPKDDSYTCTCREGYDGSGYDCVGE